MSRQINSDGLNIIKSCEGLRLLSYKCPALVLTVGYGHTGPDVKMGMKITPERAEELLRSDLYKFCEGVEKLVKTPIDDNQFSALVSFSFNVGLTSLKDSTLLRMINAGQVKESADQFLRWNKAGGKVLAGLTKRREMERNLFLSGNK